MITLLVPTMNRPDFVGRLLRYYADTGFTHAIAIGDSSEPVHARRIQEEIRRHAPALKADYQPAPGLNDSQCLSQLIRNARTPYAAFLADDDFLVPEGLDQCVAFLEQHPEYSAAHGVGIVLRLDASGAHGRPVSSRFYRQPSAEAGTAAERLAAHLGSYTVSLFSVHRTETWRAIYRDVPQLTDKTFTELLPSCLSVVEGNVKALPCFYLVRHDHDQRYLLPSRFDWITGRQWLPSYEVFRDRLAEALTARDHLGAEEARELVERAFWRYLSGQLADSWRSRYGACDAPRPTAAALWQRLRRRLARPEWSLPALLDPSAPHAQAMAPVLRALAGHPARVPVSEDNTLRVAAR